MHKGTAGCARRRGPDGDIVVDEGLRTWRLELMLEAANAVEPTEQVKEIMRAMSEVGARQLRIPVGEGYGYVIEDLNRQQAERLAYRLAGNYGLRARLSEER